jgi:aminoglycoside 6'-N-acetyltransferase I
MQHILIRQADPHDLSELAEMFHRLWPDATAAEHTRDLNLLLTGHAPGQLPTVLFVAQDSTGRLLGFIGAGLRSHADGCNPAQPVGFIEGWYVAPEHRRRKIGARLVVAAEEWARLQGCIEMASDAWLDGLDSQRAHEALGFEVVDRCVHYRKLL